MKRIHQFAGEHPTWLALGILIAWFIISGIAVALFSLLTNVHFTNIVVQSLGAAAGLVIIMVIPWQFGWLRPAGIIRIGSWKAWLAAAVGGAYLLIIYSFVFFGENPLSFLSSLSAGDPWPIVWRQLVVAAVEEILFRGLILYTLIRVWGKSKFGLVGSIFLSSLLFGLSHILQGFSGNSLSSALLVSLESFVSGLWWAAIVLIGVAVWPAVALHAVSNMSVLIRLLTLPGKELADSAFMLAAVLQLPLVFILFFVVLRSFPRPGLPEIHHFGDD